MSNAKYSLPLPPNEPVCTYAPQTPERASLKEKIAELRNSQIDIPLIIGGEEIRTGNTGTCILPHEHGTVIGTYHKAGEKEILSILQRGHRRASCLNSIAGYRQT